MALNEVSLSYLVPSYNHGKYILELLESIRLDMLHLSVPAELVIVDDGSKDDSEKVIRQWVADNEYHINVTCVFLPENKGIPAVVNKLVTLSSGEFLRFSGSDDILVQGSTQKLLDVFFGRDRLACVFGDASVIDHHGQIINSSSISFHGGNVARLTNSKMLKAELIQNWCLAGPSFLIRKNHYERMRYDESLKIDDYDLYLSLLERSGAVTFLNFIVCRYRVHDSNTSKTRDVEKRIDNLDSFLKIVDKYIDRGVLKDELIFVKYKTMAKIRFLQKKYLSVVLYMTVYGILKFRHMLKK